MPSRNKVMLLGRLGQDPVLNYTKNQTPVCNLSVATTETGPGENGETQEYTEWHKVVVWGKQAENCGKYLKKGSLVDIEGKLKTRSWDDNGTKRQKTEIVASTVMFLDKTGKSTEVSDS